MSSNNQFICVSCTDQYNLSTTKAYIVQQYAICNDCAIACLVPRFKDALAQEYNYPVDIGKGVNASADIFADLLGQNFVVAYQRKEVEYKTPPGQRVYCQNMIRTDKSPGEGEEASRPIALSAADADAARSGGVEIKVCGAMIAEKSGLSDAELAATSCYHCGGFSMCDVQTEDFEDKFKELTIGKDYQRCPGNDCGIYIQRSAYCNHMVCTRCATSFCNCCGLEAAEDSGHWRTTCPRNGQPGTDTAVFDIALDDLEAVNGVFDDDLAPAAVSEGHLAGPADGETWLAIPEEARNNARAYIRAIQHETRIMPLGPLHELLGDTVSLGLELLYGITTARGVDLQANLNWWTEVDIRLRSMANRASYPGILDLAAVLSQAIDFLNQHRQSFTTQLRARVAQLNEWDPQAPAALDPFPSNAFTGYHPESVVRASRFMSQARYQFLSHPEVQALAVEDWEEILWLSSIVEVMIAQNYFGSGRRFNEDNSNALTVLLGGMANMSPQMLEARGRISVRLALFPLLTEAVTFWKDHWHSFQEQALAHERTLTGMSSRHLFVT